VVAITRAKAASESQLSCRPGSNVCGYAQARLAIGGDVGLAGLDLPFGAKPVDTLPDFFSGRAALDDIITMIDQGCAASAGASAVSKN
jgi:MinD-like ATPase involved in chromosome partitioning or flagellar assembly